jgi:K+-transporting ATPase ATPase C chain
MGKRFKTSFLFTMIATIGLGIIYPILVTGVGLLIPASRPALLDASIIEEGLFHGRPTMSGRAYSGASNLSLTNPGLWKQVLERSLRESERHRGVFVPRELLFSSASGYDSNLSSQGALRQMMRISQSHNLDIKILKQMVDHHTYGKFLGFIGTERVNIVSLNQDLENLVATTQH